MRKGLLLIVMALTLSSCATTQHVSSSGGGEPKFHRFAACVERNVGGRILHDPGWVVGVRESDGGNRFFSFMSTYWGRIIEVARVNRFCSALHGQFDGAADATFRDPRRP